MPALTTHQSRLFASPLPVVVALAMLLLPIAARGASSAVGLSSVRARLFANEDLGLYKAQPSDRFGSALASGDFNGDGADDLATGIPFDNGLFGAEKPGIGGVVVRYGRKGSGLDTAAATTMLNQLPAGSPDPAEPVDLFGSALAACDFNGDGFADLAVGIPGEDGGTDGDWANSGAVQIHYGASGGIHVVGDQFLTQDTPGIPDQREPQDRFGFALACGDFDRDGFADLAIGAPSESLDGGLFNVGTVAVVPGSAAGLDATRAIGLYQGAAGMLGASEKGDGFGVALAIGDFNHDGFDDLAIGIPGEDAQDGGPFDDTGKGAVQIVFGTSGGLTATGNLQKTETDFGGLAEPGDFFGRALASGDFDGDGFADLAVGGFGEDYGDGMGGLITDCGQVIAVYGSSLGLDFGRTQVWNQGNIHGPGSDESNDHFGFALAAGDFDHDGHADLAIGQPDEAVTAPGDGALTVIMGSASGLTAARRRGITEGVEGFPTITALQTDHDTFFARALASGDFDGDGHADLAIGAPDQDGPGGIDVGAEVVLYGALFADGFETGAANLWSAKSP